MKALLLSLCLSCFALPAFAKHQDIPLQQGSVISQNIGSSDRGVAVIPIGGMLVGARINRPVNVVEIKTATARMTWVESRRDKHLIILPVNSSISFYQDREWIIVLDANRKKHKFSLTHMEMIGRK